MHCWQMSNEIWKHQNEMDSKAVRQLRALYDEIENIFTVIRMEINDKYEM